MSTFSIIKDIELAAKKDGSSYELEILLRSGRTIVCSPIGVSSSYHLKADERVFENGKPTGDTRLTYISYDAIEQVTPIWL